MNENNNTDEFFKDSFESFQVTPPKRNWEGINDKLEEKTDAIINDKFESYEVQPQPAVWENIKGQLPYNLRIRRHLNYISRIAAVLLIGMLFTMGYNVYQQQNQIAVNSAPVPVATPDVIETPIPVVEEKNDFVFDPVSKKEKAKKLIDEKEDIDDLLQFILDDSDDIAANIDSEVVEESLTPADELTEGIALVTPEDDDVVQEDYFFDTDVEADLTIKIPLTVVEESEIETLINIYDANAAPSHGPE